MEPAQTGITLSKNFIYFFIGIPLALIICFLIAVLFAIKKRGKRINDKQTDTKEDQVLEETPQEAPSDDLKLNDIEEQKPSIRTRIVRKATPYPNRFTKNVIKKKRLHYQK